MKTLHLMGDLMHLFYPALCVGCGGMLVKEESVLCMHCLHRLPRTQFATWPDNPVASLFWGRVALENATAWCFFLKESLMRRTVHNLKYADNPELAVALGRAFAYDLNNSNFTDCQCVIPVPLHPKKLYTRGYNQSECIARGMGSVLAIPVVSDLLIRCAGIETQTRRHRFERWTNVEESFTLLHGAGVEGKHLLLVDDVVTTGATLEACARVLLTIPGVRVSIAVLAVA